MSCCSCSICCPHFRWMAAACYGRSWRCEYLTRGRRRVAANVGQGFAFVFGFVGLLTTNPFLIFIAFFVYIGASQEAALAQMRDVSRRFPVSSAMVREFRTLGENATLEEAVDALLATSQHDFPVVAEDGNVAGFAYPSRSDRRSPQKRSRAPRWRRHAARYSYGNHRDAF